MSSGAETPRRHIVALTASVTELGTWPPAELPSPAGLGKKKPPLSLQGSAC